MTNEFRLNDEVVLRNGKPIAKPKDNKSLTMSKNKTNDLVERLRLLAFDAARANENALATKIDIVADEVAALRDSSAELKPCPFCGGAARLIEVRGLWTAECAVDVECRGSSDVMPDGGNGYHSKNLAVAAWNTRSPHHGEGK